MTTPSTTSTGTVSLPTGQGAARPAATSRGSNRSRAWRLFRRREGTAFWERPALGGLLAVTALLSLWNLSVSGWANSFYAAAVQAGTKSWEAFFFGSSDAANSITVDKPPMSLWFMEISARIFGFSSFSMLLPEALMGVATVAVLYFTVRRHFSAPIALVAGGALAFTPVAALMFRFNNPDALLVLLMTLAVFFTMKGVDSGRIRWVVWAGTMVGFGLLTKELQAFLVLPVLAAVYVVAAPLGLRKRLLHLLAALGAIVVSAGWWVAVVTLVPASMRPYIGGSQTNSFLELTFGYNGFGRLTGNETGSVTGGTSNTAGGQWGDTGILRLFTSEFGGQIAWLLPAALALLIAGIVVVGRRPRVDARRALLLVFGGWTVITWLAFSFMAGIFHAYYTVALAPAIAGTVAMGAGLVWERRSSLWARILLAVTVLGTSIWAYSLLSLATDWLPWLKFVVVALGVVGAVLMLLPARDGRAGRWLTAAAVSVSLAAGLVAPLAYSLQTVSTAHTGSIVTAGPTVASSMGGMGGGGGAGGGGGFGGGTGGPGGTGTGTGTTGGTGTAPGGTAGGSAPTGTAPGAGTTGGTTTGGTTTGGAGTAPTGTAPTGTGGGGGGSLVGTTTVSATLTKLLQANASSYTWVAAAVGSNTAAGYQLATDESVMPVGGFNGSDPSPTLAAFKAYVAAGEIHYFVGGTVGTSNGGSSASSEIAAWVEADFTATTVSGVTLYDLTAAK